MWEDINRVFENYFVKHTFERVLSMCKHEILYSSIILII